MSTDKRKRSANFNDDEKLKFLRILQRKGKVVISKVTSHDIKTNRQKEEAWALITSDLNASGTVLRTTDNLKKLWQKLKTEAKAFKSIARNQISGTGGGPSKKVDEPVLELVVEITGRGSSGIELVNDCDFEIAHTNTDLDTQDILMPVRTSTPAVIEEVASYFEVESMTNVSPQLHEREKKNLKRRRPSIDPNANERSEVTATRVRLNNSFASERLKCEKDKSALIELQKQHMLELHAIHITQAQIKTEIMKTILKKIQDEQPMDPELVKIVLRNE